jgi:ATP-dependent RNA helicase HelY
VRGGRHTASGNAAEHTGLGWTHVQTHSPLVEVPHREADPQVAVAVSDAWQATARLWSALAEDERRHRLERTREPDAGFAWPVYRWARGESLEKVLTAAEVNGQELSAGDFVRWCRQVIDLLDQVQVVLGRQDQVGQAAWEAVRAVRRGVVAAGTA